MPTKPKIYVYAIIRKDFDHHTDRKGRANLVSIHATVDGANAAGRAHTEKQAANARSAAPPDVSHSEKDGIYHGFVQTFEDRRDNFEVIIKKMALEEGETLVQGGSEESGKKRKAGETSQAKRKRKSGDDEVVVLSD